MTPWRRAAHGAVLGGVASGLAVRLGVRTSLVRMIWLVSVLLGGLGLVAYVAGWVFVPRRAESRCIAARVWAEPRERHASAVAAAVLVVLVLAVSGVTRPLSAGVLWPILPSALGALLVWRGASSAERERLAGSWSAPLVRVGRDRSWRATALRVGVGSAGVLVGLNVLAGARTSPTPLSNFLGGLVVTGAGLLVLFTPWWIQTVRELSEERLARSRAQARADVADHLHDSVLQMLALIQKAADDPAEVRRLARTTEHDLRAWLFEDQHAPRDSFAARVADLSREIEQDYAVRVELVTVGDAVLDAGLEAVLGATREAVINAAKWSGARDVHVYAEVSDEVSVFVRDRGRGFDPEAVDPQRRGLAFSIQERVARAGGRTSVRTRIGEGTEVEIVMKRAHP